MNHILAIDQGTSGTKAVIFDAEGGIAAAATAELASSFPRPGFVEQDPRAILGSVIEAVGACTARFRDAGGDPRDIITCGISNQRETFLLWDARGTPLCNAVSWQCERSVAICERLRAEGQSAEVAARTGLIIAPYFSGTKLLWLMENDPAVRAAVRAGAARFGTVDAWLLQSLTRDGAFATDHTNASRTLLFNIDSLTWDDHLLKTWGLADLILPPAYPSQHPYGETDFDGALPRPVPIDAMIGDSHAAAFGEGCISAGSAKATMGTGSSVLMNVGGKRCLSHGGMVATICWSLPGRVQYALEGIIISCGATIAWLRDQLGLFAASADTEEIARAVQDSGGVFLVPAFSGLGSPHWRMSLKASIVGLSFATGRNHIVRAALESIPFQIADVIASMETDTGLRPTALRVDGGMTSNGFVVQFLADLLGIPVVSMGIAEASAFGAAAIAGLGAGVYSGLEELAGLPRSETWFRVGPDSGQAKKRHEEWKRILSTIL
ncbi:MAG: glycerol kinase GlpK [Spirochaetia bacterium]